MSQETIEKYTQLQLNNREKKKCWSTLWWLCVSDFFLTIKRCCLSFVVLVNVRVTKALVVISSFILSFMLCMCICCYCMNHKNCVFGTVAQWNCYCFPFSILYFIWFCFHYYSLVWRANKIERARESERERERERLLSRGCKNA